MKHFLPLQKVKIAREKITEARRVGAPRRSE